MSKQENKIELSNKQLCTMHVVVGQSEQLKCKCKKAKFTRIVNEYYEPTCGRCGLAL